MPEWKWRLLQYVSPAPAGRKAIEDWRKSLPVGSPRADLDAFLRVMAKKMEWSYPDIGSLKGKKYKGLSELRWRSGNVPYRIIGYTSEDHVYVMLIGCTHNGRKYDPPDALQSAVDRNNRVSKREATTCEYPLLTDR